MREGVRGWKRSGFTPQYVWTLRLLTKKLQRIIELRNELNEALGELNNVDSEPYLVLKEENPAPKE